MSLKKFLMAAALAAFCSGIAFAASEPNPNVTAWTPTHAKTSVRVPMTTRNSVKGRAVSLGDNQYSAMAGYNILYQGGTAFDAAVAMASVMSITNPTMNDFFGGDAMIIVYSAKDKKVITYNGSGWAPKKATLEKYIEDGGIPSNGILSVEIPGSFSGWMTLLKDYGTMPLSEILAPAIDLAENGHAFSGRVSRAGASIKGLNDAAKAIYYRGDRLAYGGEKVVNPDYAKTLRELAPMSYQEAEDYVYRGPIAADIVAFSHEMGGLMELEDFADFHAEKVDSHSTNFRGIDVYVCPPNSQGWTLLEALNILEPYDLAAMGHNSAEYIDIIVQAVNLALQDRNHFIADPRFHANPVALIGKEYAAERRKDMHPGTAMDGELSIGAPTDTEKFGDVTYGISGDTTFMTVADAFGNIVACTTSLCGTFGSGLAVPGRGFMLNNRMTYFFLDEDYPNYLQPRKRTIQTITPSIALKDGRPYLAFGTPGADVQEQSKLQVLLNIALFGMDPQEAVEAPRFETRHPMGILGHASYPRTIHAEARVPEAVRKELEEKYGYIVQTNAEWEYVGLMGAIGFNYDEGFLIGGADPRADHTAIGF